ncbi:MAG: FAD-dependent oxidoreductase [Roseinatronobacter sp.]
MHAARTVVLIGGGHTHALLLHELARAPLPDVALHVINPGPSAPYTGMLPGFIAGHYARAELEIDLARLARRVDAQLHLDRCIGLDPQTRQIALQGGGRLGYDLVSVDIGITSDLPALPGYREHAVSAKPLGAYADRWSDWCAQIESEAEAGAGARAGAGAQAIRSVVIGGGVAGVELALAQAHRLRRRQPRITLIEADRLLPGVGPRARARLIAHLEQAGVQVIEGARVIRIGPDSVTLEDGRIIASGFTLGATGSRPQDWLRDTGLALTGGFITVDADLRSITAPQVFAVGDCAHMRHAPRAKAGVYAVRQAPYLLANLRAALGQGQPRPYHPQRDYLKLISLGDQRALADKWGLALEGGWLWQLKDRIDARFMGQFQD